MSPRRKLIIIAGIALGILISVTALAWFGFRQSVPVGKTTFLIVTTPATAQAALSNIGLARLPLSWQHALASPSSWPVALGGGLSSEGWEWFAVLPRWRRTSNLARSSAGLTTLIYDQPPAAPHQSTNYANALLQTARTPLDDARGWFELGDVSSSSSLVTFGYRRGILRTSLPFENAPADFAPRRADISLSVASLNDLARQELLENLPVPSFAKLNSLKEIHLVLGQQDNLEGVQLVHELVISTAEAKQIMAGFGVTNRRVIKLDDGTLATELIYAETTSNKPINISRDQKLWIQDQEIRYGSSTETLPPVPTSCPTGTTVGRLSPVAINKLLQSLGLSFDAPVTRGWQLAKDKHGTLTACME